MKWFFMRRQNPKFDAFVQRSTGGPAISTQCSCSSESIFYAIKNWEFGGRTPTHIFILPLFVFPVFLFQLLKSTFSWFFRQRGWDYPDLTNNEVVGGFQPIQTLSSSPSCFHYNRWAQLSMGRTSTQALPTTSTEKYLNDKTLIPNSFKITTQLHSFLKRCIVGFSLGCKNCIYLRLQSGSCSYLQNNFQEKHKYPKSYSSR